MSPVGGRGRWFERADATVWALVANVALFVVEVGLAGSRWAFASVPSPALYTLGMSDALAVLHELRLETLVTSCFVHGGALHLAANLYVLVLVGPPVERALGTGRTAALYLGCGVAGSLASAAVAWIGVAERTSLGFSGAIAGVLAAALVLGLRREGSRSSLARSMVRWLGLLAALAVTAAALHVASHMDNAAHLGAAAVGAAVGACLPVQAPPPRARGGSWGLRVAAVTVLACFAVTVYRGERDPFSTLGATERCDLASILIRSGQCDDGRSALDAAARLSPGQPVVLALEGEWHRTCAVRAPRGEPSS